MFYNKIWKRDWEFKFLFLHMHHLYLFYVKKLKPSITTIQIIFILSNCLKIVTIYRKRSACKVDKNMVEIKRKIRI